MDELVTQCNSLNLSAEEKKISLLTEDARIKGDDLLSKCLVGRLVTNKRANREAFIKRIQQIWCDVGKVDVEVIGGKTYIFRFPTPADREKIISQESWHFDKQLLVIQKPDLEGDVSKMTFRWSNFWIQIHNIPIKCITKLGAEQIASRLGEIIELPIEDRDCWGSFIRVKVRLDISKPLLRHALVQVDENSSPHLVSFKYEKLPDFCHGCGCLDHTLFECPDPATKDIVRKGGDPQYNSSLRAQPPDRDWRRHSPTKQRK